MASRTEKQKLTYYDHFAKRWRCDGKGKRNWLKFLKTSANKKYRRIQKKEIKEFSND